jgi:hypothetical protein
MMTLMPTKTINVYFNDGTQKILSVDKRVGVQTQESEGHMIAHFGRREQDANRTVWIELMCAPLTSLHHWGLS